MTCDSLLRNISMVFQKVYLFHDTIENNIRFGNPSATKEEIIEAAKKARCHDFIMALPDGYETVIGEGGSTLSGGEKQRISIARAILKNANIVILDEATASIDPENEHLIQQAISELTIGKTVIVIAHRLATIEHADQILVVDKGQVVQKGTHQQLVQLGGLYPFCTEDTLVEVSDEIAEAFLLDKRAEAARERKMYRYKAFYSLDCDDGIEKAAIGWAQPSPEDCLMEKEAQAEYAELLRRLYEALATLTPAQARRVHARYMLGMKVKDIAAMEGITPSQAGKSIHAALRRLRRYFIRRKWTSGL